MQEIKNYLTVEQFFILTRENYCYFFFCKNTQQFTKIFDWNNPADAIITLFKHIPHQEKND